MKPETLAISQVVSLREEEMHAFDLRAMIRKEQRERLIRKLFEYLPDGQRSVVCIQTRETPEYSVAPFSGPGPCLRIETRAEVTPVQYQQVTMPVFDRRPIVQPVCFPSIKEFIRQRSAAMRAKLGGFVGRLEAHVERQKDDFRL